MSTFPSTPAPIDAELLDRYFAKLTTPAETDDVRRWILAHPDHALVAEALRAFPLRVDEELTTDTEAWLARVEARIVDLPVDAARLRSSGTPVAFLPQQSGVTAPVALQSSRSRVWYAAAAVAVGVALLVIGHTGLGGLLSRFGSSPAPAVAVYTTGNGERANITLPDGSLASLNVASQLEVPTTFGVGDRTLRLSGEALFTVVHHTDAPFTVMVGHTAARVLGTTFAARRYATDSAVTITVRDGRVAVQSHVLVARQEAVVDSRGAVHMHPADLASLSFATGVLTLNDVPLRDAVVELDRWYDTDIRIADPRLASERIRASFTAGSITDLSGMLEFMFGAKVIRHGRILTLTSKG